MKSWLLTSVISKREGDTMADVYICHSMQDEKEAALIAAYLQKESIATCRIDSLLHIEGEFEEAVVAAICECKIFLFLFSEHTSRSCFTDLGIAEAYNKIVVPVLLDDSLIPFELGKYRCFRWDIDTRLILEELVSFLQSILNKQAPVVDEEMSEQGAHLSRNSISNTKDEEKCSEKTMQKVFLSHDSDDFAKVDKYRKLIESHGIPCWIAPRDIPYGSNYAREIPPAIENCCCVLVFVSKHSQTSENMEKEIEIAVEYRKKIIPVRLENCDFKGSYIYHLKNKQWFDAYNSREEDIRKLINSIGGIEEQVSKKPPENNVDFSPKIISILAVLAVTIILAGIIKIGQNLLREIRTSEMMSLLFAVLIPILCIICIISYKIFKKKK